MKTAGKYLLFVPLFLFAALVVKAQKGVYVFNEKADRFMGRYFNPYASVGIGLDRAGLFMPSVGLKTGPFDFGYSVWDNFSNETGFAIHSTVHILKLNKDENPIRVLGLAYNRYTSIKETYFKTNLVFHSMVLDLSGYRVGSRMRAYLQFGVVYSEVERVTADPPRSLQVVLNTSTLPIVGFGFQFNVFRMPEWGKWD